MPSEVEKELKESRLQYSGAVLALSLGKCMRKFYYKGLRILLIMSSPENTEGFHNIVALLWKYVEKCFSQMLPQHF